MKHIITCSNVDCRYNDGYTHCQCKVIGMTSAGNCATFVPKVANQKKIDISSMENTQVLKGGMVYEIVD